MKALIWRDAIDKDMLHIGVPEISGPVTHRLALYCDSFCDLFGKEAETWVKENVQYRPVPITLTLTPEKE